MRFDAAYADDSLAGLMSVALENMQRADGQQFRSYSTRTSPIIFRIEFSTSVRLI